MAVVKCPTGCVSVSMIDSGVLIPDADGFITVTPAEATILVSPYARPRVHSSNASGQLKLFSPGMQVVMGSYTVGATSIQIGSDSVDTSYQSAVNKSIVVRDGFKLVSG